MGARKRFYVRSINFGTGGMHARQLIEQYQKKYGKASLSKLIRKLVVIYFMDNQDFKIAKARMLINEKRHNAEIISQCCKRMHEIDDMLKEMGYNPEDIIL